MSDRARKAGGMFTARPVSAPAAVTGADDARRAAAPSLPARIETAAVAVPALTWDSLPRLSPCTRSGARDGLSVVQHDPAARSFDLLRTRLVQTLKAHGWQRVAIASPTSGCGATFTAINLALSLSRVPHSRNMLIDLNLRRPGVAAGLGITSRASIRPFLAGAVPAERHLKRLGDNLALGLNGMSEAHASDLLHDREATETLDRMLARLRPDVVLYDLPPVLEHDDLAAFLPHVDGVLLIADGTQTQARHIAACERILDGQTNLLGVILNRARRSAIPRYER